MLVFQILGPEVIFAPFKFDPLLKKWILSNAKSYFCHTVMVYCIFYLFWCWWCWWREELILSAARPGASWHMTAGTVSILHLDTNLPQSHPSTTKSAPDRWDSSTSQLFNHHTRSSRSANIIELINLLNWQKFSKKTFQFWLERNRKFRKNSYLWNMIDAIYKNPGGT